MLNKILSTLQFDSDHSSKLHRLVSSLKKEKVLRGLGLTFLVLALIMQFAAEFTPTKSNAAASFNDLVPGGVTSQQQLVNDCNSNAFSVQQIYAAYGVSCQAIAQGSVMTLNSTSYNDGLYSMGHLQEGIAGEQPVDVAGSTMWWRLLHGWDTHGYSLYTAVQLTNSQGKTFFILFTCGNLVSIGFPTQVPPPAPQPTPQPTPPACPYNNLILLSSPECKPCTQSTNFNDIVNCLTYSKSASNMTQSISDANNTTAKAGDIIQYQLTAKNTGKATQIAVIVKDDLSDVLEYANIQNMNGGTLDSKNMLSWPAVDIAPGAEVSKSFTVQVKNPVPDFAPSPDDPNGYNNVMTNVYFNTINIKVQPTIVQAVAQTTLVNTGPGTSIFILFIVTTVAGYLYTNRRLQIKEARIALNIEASEAAR